MGFGHFFLILKMNTPQEVNCSFSEFKLQEDTKKVGLLLNGRLGHTRLHTRSFNFCYHYQYLNQWSFMFKNKDYKL